MTCPCCYMEPAPVRLTAHLVEAHGWTEKESSAYYDAKIAAMVEKIREEHGHDCSAHIT